MSDRFYTTLDVSGPNAVAAEKAAIEALKNLSKDDQPYRWSHETTKAEQEAEWEQWARGFYYDADTVREWEQSGVITPEKAEECRRASPHFFDHNSGDAAIVTVAKMSRNFPNETYELYVNGGCAEGVQGLVTIRNGFVLDGRCEEIAYGDPSPYGDCPTVMAYLDADGNDAIASQTEADTKAAFEAMKLAWVARGARFAEKRALAEKRITNLRAVARQLMDVWEALPVRDQDDSDFYYVESSGLDKLTVKGGVNNGHIDLDWNQVVADIFGGYRLSGLTYEKVVEPNKAEGDETLPIGNF